MSFCSFFSIFFFCFVYFFSQFLRNFRTISIPLCFRLAAARLPLIFCSVSAHLPLDFYSAFARLLLSFRSLGFFPEFYFFLNNTSFDRSCPALSKTPFFKNCLKSRPINLKAKLIIQLSLEKI